MSLTSPIRALATLLSFQLPGRSYAACVKLNSTGPRFESVYLHYSGRSSVLEEFGEAELQGPRPLAERGRAPVGVDADPLYLHNRALIHACTLRVKAPFLCDSVSYVQDHKPIYLYVRSIIPIG